jgi:hypothetical protein
MPDDDINIRLSKLEAEIKELKKAESKKEKKEKKEQKPKKPSEYNNYMGKYISDKKKELGELYNHKTIFAEAAKKWKEQKQQQN